MTIPEINKPDEIDPEPVMSSSNDDIKRPQLSLRPEDLTRARYLTTEIDTEVEDASLKKNNKPPPPSTWMLTTWILTWWAPPFILKAAGI